MKKVIFLLLLIFSIISCKKEVFPSKSSLIGTWVEQVDNSFKHKLIFKEEKLYFFKSTSTDTLTYWLDENQEKLYLSHHSGGESNHKISFNKNKEELTVFGLFPSINLSETVFKKK